MKPNKNISSTVKWSESSSRDKLPFTWREHPMDVPPPPTCPSTFRWKNIRLVGWSLLKPTHPSLFSLEACQPKGLLCAVLHGHTALQEESLSRVNLATSFWGSVSALLSHNSFHSFILFLQWFRTQAWKRCWSSDAVKPQQKDSKAIAWKWKEGCPQHSVGTRAWPKNIRLASLPSC